MPQSISSLNNTAQVLPPEVLRKLQYAFRDDALLWHVHGYPGNDSHPTVVGDALVGLQAQATLVITFRFSEQLRMLWNLQSSITCCRQHSQLVVCRTRASWGPSGGCTRGCLKGLLGLYTGTHSTLTRINCCITRQARSVSRRSVGNWRVCDNWGRLL